MYKYLKQRVAKKNYNLRTKLFRWENDTPVIQNFFDSFVFADDNNFNLEKGNDVPDTVLW